MDLTFKATELKDGKLDKVAFNVAYLCAIRHSHPNVYAQFKKLIELAEQED